MSDLDRPIRLATRGSALALTQTRMVLAQCRQAFPDLHFEVKIIKTTGDKLQSVPPDAPGMSGTKGLFTKELEIALVKGDADLAVHSLKDLPTELPEGLELGAVLPRADVRDLLIYRGAATHSDKRGLPANSQLRDFPNGATIATSSTRRQAQLQTIRSDLKVVPIRGNVGTRLQKLADRAELDGLVLAAAGLHRLGFNIGADHALTGPAEAKVPPGLHAIYLPIEEMIPCVGQGAIGIETRIGDQRTGPITKALNDARTLQCVTAERAFLHGMGGGCLSPVAAYAEFDSGELFIRAISFRSEKMRRTQGRARPEEAVALGARAAAELRE
jgi:hydroxymethylbilane synthase